MKPRAAERATRIRQLQGYCEEVLRLTTVDTLLPSGTGEAIVVKKDHAGAPGAVIIEAHHVGGRIEHWKRSLKGWYVAKTEQPQ